MKLFSIDDLSIRPQPQPVDQLPRSELILYGETTGKIVEGAVLEAAICWRGHFLIFLTDDIINEDTLRIYLLDPKLDMVDAARLGGMYSTGAFSALQLVEPNLIRFEFFGDTTWTLELLDDQSFSVPMVSDPKGVTRPFRLSHRFKLHGDPIPSPD
ncbi:hypothetical protein JOD97_003359 [Duganella sp. 1411]|uniref:hypothetical protein n=1 Tax=Duganella sp. 1411 TaxID=2806572 RepID=UPI001AE381B5|nr:hypothetical protein [Duganella sp. 1411]MBP1205317.1 hypothetical protein [Duganella sp. 1411]